MVQFLDIAPRLGTVSRSPRGAASIRTRRELLQQLNIFPWEGNVVRWTHCLGNLSTRVDAVIAIPVHDDAERIEACLDACARSAAASKLVVRILVLVNGSSDGTAHRVLKWALHRVRPLTLIDVDFTHPLAHAGAARRLVMQLAGAHVAPDTALLTTNSGARPSIGWVKACVEHLRGGASLVCGRVLPDFVQHGPPPPHVGSANDIERLYRRLSLQLEQLVDPAPWNSGTYHGRVPGASLAMTARGLKSVGGVPLIARGGDEALARRVRAHGLPVVHAHDVLVTTSYRTAGRAPHGDEPVGECAPVGADPDRSCDERLDSAASLHARVTVRARLRHVWSRQDARVGALLECGAAAPLAEDLARLHDFECAWRAFEAAVLEPDRTPLRLRDIQRESVEMFRRIRSVRSGRLRADDTGRTPPLHDPLDLARPR